jgi:hypothetical protein
MTNLTQLITIPFWALITLVLSASLLTAMPLRVSIPLVAHTLWWTVALPPRAVWWVIKALFRGETPPAEAPQAK